MSLIQMIFASPENLSAAFVFVALVAGLSWYSIAGGRAYRARIRNMTPEQRKAYDDEREADAQVW